MGIATNANDATLAITQQCLLLNSFFDNHVYGISCVNNVGKPNPAIYLHAAHQLGIDPHECIAIEDSANGIRAAQQAGMFCIGITTSGNPYQTEKAHLVVDSYKEIPLKELISA